MVEPVDRRSGSGSKPPEAQPQTEPLRSEPEPIAQAEPAHTPEPPTEQTEHQHGMQFPEPDIHILMQMLFEQAMFALGRIPGLAEGEQQVDLSLAKFQIDLLEVLQQKTRNNLSAIEEKYLDEYLHQARLAFVSAQKQRL